MILVITKHTLKSWLGLACVILATVGAAVSMPSTAASAFLEGDSAESDDPNAVEAGEEDDFSDLPEDTAIDWQCMGPDLCPPPIIDRPPPGNAALDTTTAAVIDRSEIAHYARQYAGDLQNPTSSAGYNTFYRVFRKNDCQNFVSQALRAGGWGDDDVGANTWYYDKEADGQTFWSPSWPLVGRFMTYVKRDDRRRGQFVRYFSDAAVGDVVFVDWSGPNPTLAPIHSMIVTRIDFWPGHSQFDLRLTYHTNNRVDKSLRALRADPNNDRAVWWLFHLYNSY
jgi:hypothetical protein